MSHLIRKKSFKANDTCGLAKSFCPGCLEIHSFLAAANLPSCLDAFALFYSYSTPERASEQPIRPLAHSSVPLRATNGLWIASSFCRATSFTGGFHSPLYPRAHHVTVKINLTDSLNAVKFERKWMMFRNPQKPSQSLKLDSMIIDYLL